MNRWFFALAALFFFFAAVHVTILPNPQSWGLVSLAIGLAIGGWTWTPWRKPAG